MKKYKNFSLLSAVILCLLFFLFYLILGLIRHEHFLSGYDLGVIDQGIWKYSHFKAPISTNHAYPFTSILTDHVELIFIVIAPLYWIVSDVRVLITLQALLIAFSGIAVFLIARKKGITTFLSLSLLFSYLLFYGIQHAIWSDVHSLVFGVSFLAWFIYGIETNIYKIASVFFVLSILSKEDMALFTLLLSSIYYIRLKKRIFLIYILISFLYLSSIFFIYFPYFVPGGYRFQSDEGLLATISPLYLYNTKEKIDVWLYSFGWFGFLPILSPLYALPVVADLTKYFVLGNTSVTSAQGLFMHYRSSLALLLVLPTIYSIAYFPRLNRWYTAVYIILTALFLQYHLHLPISYLTKQWFWTTPKSTHTIRASINALPQNASVITQVNIDPHISQRDEIFILWPEKKEFSKNSPCGEKKCSWFRSVGKPEYMLVDTATDWDARYWLTDRDTFIQGVKNLEKMQHIKPVKTEGTTTLYKVKKMW
jgi:uncharacterized membrane protein